LQSCPQSERTSLQQAIAQIDSGRMRARANAVAQYQIVGATCAATGLPCLQGAHFDLVLLDECSQATSHRAVERTPASRRAGNDDVFVLMRLVSRVARSLLALAPHACLRGSRLVWRLSRVCRLPRSRLSSIPLARHLS
jgi:hypothetical protein